MGGDERTNAFIAEVGQQTEALYSVKVEQVKLTDTADAFTRVISEKAPGQTTGGSVDMIWINGPNFLAIKEHGLLQGPVVAGLPNARFLGGCRHRFWPYPCGHGGGAGFRAGSPDRQRAGGVGAPAGPCRSE